MKKSIAERELINALKKITFEATKGVGVEHPLAFIAGHLSQVPQLDELHKAFCQAQIAVASQGGEA